MSISVRFDILSILITAIQWTYVAPSVVERFTADPRDSGSNPAGYWTFFQLPLNSNIWQNCFSVIFKHSGPHELRDTFTLNRCYLIVKSHKSRNISLSLKTLITLFIVGFVRKTNQLRSKHLFLPSFPQKILVTKVQQNALI